MIVTRDCNFIHILSSLPEGSHPLFPPPFPQVQNPNHFPQKMIWCVVCFDQPLTPLPSPPLLSKLNMNTLLRKRFWGGFLSQALPPLPFPRLQQPLQDSNHFCLINQSGRLLKSDPFPPPPFGSLPNMIFICFHLITFQPFQLSQHQNFFRASCKIKSQNFLRASREVKY